MPGTHFSVPIGTLEIADHLNRAQRDCDWTDLAARIGVEWPSVAAGQRYQAVLFIEKERFTLLLEEARIAGAV